ncbi:MAG TPA: VWA domain-containing protein [Phycisphaerae bacterium]|nr:VWA domain-containing protein [Phycisphaerae bacterium]
MVRLPSSSMSAVTEVSLAAADDRAWDRLMAWLALYIPTYGTSMALHTAVVLLMAFMVMTMPTDQVPFNVTASAFMPLKYEFAKRQAADRPPQYRGKARPEPGSLAHTSTPKPVQDVARNWRDQLIVIGDGTSGRDIGDTGGPSSQRIFATSDRGPSVEGVRKIVYVVDRSGSMGDSLDVVKVELKRSLTELGDDAEFHVIFYSSGPPAEMPTRRLVPATERNKELACEFIDHVVAQGQTDPSQAIRRALAAGPELIYLLTDGEFDRAIIDLVRHENAGRNVRVFTIGFVYRAGEEILRQIARENHGEYKFISRDDLEWVDGP